MQIKVSGTDSFVNLIKIYHESLMTSVLKAIPEFKTLNHITIEVKETSTLSDVGLSRFDYKEMLISHQLTSQNPKFLLEVYGHELAHFLVTYKLQRNIQHGPEWVAVMKAMNLPAREAVSFSQSKIQELSVLTVKCGCMFNGTKKVKKSSWNPKTPCPVCHKKFSVI